MFKNMGFLGGGYVKFRQALLKAPLIGKLIALITLLLFMKDFFED
jgi:hypothetical protein